jgi:hypothetical protein
LFSKENSFSLARLKKSTIKNILLVKKKIILVLSVFMCIVTKAQDLKVGAKAGINFSRVGGDDTEDYSGKIGLHLGGVGVYMFSDKFGAQAELLYSSYGAKLEKSESNDFGSFEETQTSKLNYISLPLLAKYMVSDEFSIEAGPRVAFLSSAKTDFEVSETDEDGTFSESGSEDISDEISGIDLGFAIGGSYLLENGLFFSLRYSLGLSNIYDSTNANLSQQNNALQFSVGYFFFED